MDGMAIMPYQHFLGDKLSAIKRRRPDAQISEPEGKIASQLLHDAFDLSDGVDPVDWLAVERSDTVAILTLGILIDMAVQVYSPGRPRLDTESSRTALIERIRMSRPNNDQVRLAAPGRPAWVPRLHSGLGIKQMLGDFSNLRKQIAETSTPSLGAAQTPRSLLNELMRLADNVEPIEWLRTHHASLCSEIVLDYLLTSLMPVAQMSHEAATLGMDRTTPIRTKTLSRGRIKIDIRSLVMIEHGFVLKVRCRFRRNIDSRGPSEIVRWDGFRHVTDDAGHFYVPLRAVTASSHRLWWQTQETMIICWPAIKDGGTLTFTSKPAHLSIYRPSNLHGELLYEQGADVGELSYTVLTRLYPTI